SDSPMFDYLRIQKGRKLIADDQNKVIIGRDLARQINKSVGDEIELYGTEKLEIVGIFFSNVTIENLTIVAPLKTVQTLTHHPGEASSIGIIVNDPADKAAIDDLCNQVANLQPGLEIIKTKRQ